MKKTLSLALATALGVLAMAPIFSPPVAHAQKVVLVPVTSQKLLVKIIPVGETLGGLTQAVFKDAAAYEQKMASALDVLSAALSLAPGVDLKRLVASPLPGWVEVDLDSALPLFNLFELIKPLAGVQVVQPNNTLYVSAIPDPLAGNQDSYLGNAYPWLPKVSAAYDKYLSANNRFDAVVIDTGAPLDATQIDTGPNRAGVDMVSSAAESGDGDGRDANPADSGYASNCSSLSSWHGSKVASVLAGMAGNSLRAYGAYYNSNGNVIHVRAAGNQCGSGLQSDVVAGISWASGAAVSGLPMAPATIRVINISLGAAGGCDAATQDAVNLARSQGIAVVAAAGNSNSNTLSNPASCTGVYSVGALDPSTGARASYSNYSSRLSASTSGTAYVVHDSGSRGPTNTYTSSYVNGTSFAAPIFAGSVLRVLSERPAWTGVQAADYLVSKLTPISHSSCANGVCGKGSVNLDAALNGLAALAPASACPANTVSWSTSQSTNPCYGNTTSAASGDSQIVSYSQGGKVLGSAQFSCTNGKWTLNSSNVTPQCRALCSAQTYVWRSPDGAGQCEAPTPALLTGDYYGQLNDSSKPYGGTAGVICQSNGTLQLNNSSCRDIRVYCPQTDVKWGTLGASCKATLPRSPEGTETTGSSKVLLGTGSKTFRCDAASVSWVPVNVGTCTYF